MFVKGDIVVYAPQRPPILARWRARVGKEGIVIRNSKPMSVATEVLFNGEFHIMKPSTENLMLKSRHETVKKGHHLTTIFK